MSCARTIYSINPIYVGLFALIPPIQLALAYLLGVRFVLYGLGNPFHGATVVSSPLSRVLLHVPRSWLFRHRRRIGRILDGSCEVRVFSARLAADLIHCLSSGLTLLSIATIKNESHGQRETASR